MRGQAFIERHHSKKRFAENVAFCATIHKSQGSEYPAVVIPIMTQHYAMLQRNLLYTGITRGKKLVVLVGQKKAVAIAVRNVSGSRPSRAIHMIDHAPQWLTEWLGGSTASAAGPPKRYRGVVMGAGVSRAS